MAAVLLSQHPLRRRQRPNVVLPIGTVRRCGRACICVPIPDTLYCKVNSGHDRRVASKRWIAPDMKQRVADLGNEGAPEVVVLLCGLASLVVLFGVLGLSDESWVRQCLGSRINAHMMFGLFLCSLIVLRFHCRLKRIAPMLRAPLLQAQIRDLSRELSRTVYLFLYMVIGIRQLAGLANWLMPGGAPEPGFAAGEDMRAIVVYGLVGLILIRVLAFGFWLHWSRGGGMTSRGVRPERP
jgi:hypothetical protein